MSLSSLSFLHLFFKLQEYLIGAVEPTKNWVHYCALAIDGCMIWTLTGTSKQKIRIEVAALKIDGCMHPFPKIEGCSCTHRICSNKDPVLTMNFINLHSKMLVHAYAHPCLVLYIS